MTYHHSPVRRSERGTILILVLLILLAVTLLGMGLVALTETEMRLGGMEQTEVSTFYAAEAGASVANARVLDGAFAPTTLVMKDPAPRAVEIGYSLELSRAVALTVNPCDFCAVNEDESAWAYKVIYLVNSTGARRDWHSIDPDATELADGVLQARSRVSVTYEVQPTEMPRLSSAVTSEPERGRFEL